MKIIKAGKKGPHGEAKVRVGSGKAQIIFKEDGSTFVFPKSELPESTKPGLFYVSLNGEGEFLSMRPMNAIVKAKFSHFAANEGDVPQPNEYPGGTAKRRDGTTFSYDAYRAMIAILDITDKEYKGMTIPVFLRYPFVDDGEGHIAIKGGGKNIELLESFLEVTGILDMDIPYSENVLPKLQKAMLKAGQEFQVMLKGGNADSFMELPEQDDDEDLEDKDEEWELEEEKLTDDDEDDDEPPF